MARTQVALLCIALAAAVPDSAHASVAVKLNNNEALPWSSTTQVVCKNAVAEEMPFCGELVNYDYHVQQGAENAAALLDSTARNRFLALENVLLKFDCGQSSVANLNGVSCGACRSAYKAWVCALHFVPCDSASTTLINEVCSESSADENNCDILGLSATASSNARPCLSLCQDILRSCPGVVSFSCPQAHEPGYLYSTKEDCNLLARE